MLIQLIKKLVKKTLFFRIYRGYRLSSCYEAKYEEEHKKNLFLIEHFDLKDMKPATGYLRYRQREIMHFAKEVFDALQEININPFLIGGNLIGWMRHGGFVPWDDDLDFGLIRSDYKKLLEFAKEKWIVLECPTEDSKQQEWIDKVTQDNAGKYILFVYAEHIQISLGSSCMDRRCVDFFTYDYYEEDADFQEFNGRIKSIKERLNRCVSESERLNIVRTEMRAGYHNVKKSSNIYFGLDSCEPYLRTFNSSWIAYDTIFPLKLIEYEGVMVNIPNKPELFISYEYPNWNSLPNDYGKESHGYWDNYKRSHLVVVEFYLVDSFEIYHFIPFYKFLRERGVYAVFIAEPQEVNVSGKWFDYERAIQILKEYELEYKEECYPEAEFAFTTQRVDILSKYKNKKINITYGCGLIKNQFAFMNESIKGFDYKFVHGPFTKELCRRNLGEELWQKNKDKIFLMGYPKWKRKEIDKSEILNELGIKTSKPIVGYFPTWGERSCIKEFHNEICALRDKYFIITKPHHCTVRIESEENDFRLLRECSDYLLPFDYDTEKALSIFELVISSADSGISLECGWLRPDIKILLITKEQNVEETFFKEVFDIAYLVNNPSQFSMRFNEAIHEDKYIMSRYSFLNEVFGDRDSNYLDDIYEQIRKREKK